MYVRGRRASFEIPGGCVNPIQHCIKAFLWVLLRFLYRVRVRHAERIPSTGAAILAPNHIAAIDAGLIAAHVFRPVRYATYWKIYDRLSWIMKPLGAFPIASKEENPEVYKRAFEIIAETLDEGGLLCIFPEGALTLDGEIGEFKSGILKILDRNPVPVIPIGLTGLWGTYFSRKKPGMFKLPDRWMAKIQMIVGEPMNPLTANQLRDRVVALTEEA